MNKVLNLLVNPFLLSFLVGAVIIFFLPPLFEKYKVDLITTSKSEDKQQYFYDLDHDGLSEWIELGNNGDSPEFPYIQCWTIHENLSDRRVIDQINWAYPWLTSSRIMFGDYDLNENEEIYVFVTNHDSLFLIGIEPLEKKEILFTKFISKIALRGQSPDFFIINGGLHDLDNDGYKEVLFILTSGFSKDPRAIFSYDIKKDSLSFTKSKFAFLSKALQIVENGNEKILLANYSTAPFNVNTETEYFTDNSAWLMAFNEKLEFVFQPIEIKGKRPSINVVAKNENGRNYFYSRYRHGYEASEQFIAKHTMGGDLIAKRTDFEKNFGALFLTHDNGRDRLWMSNSIDNALVEIKEDLSFGERYQNTSVNSFKLADLNNDSHDEFIYWDSEADKINIVSHDFSNTLSIDGVLNGKDFILSTIQLDGDDAYFAIQFDGYLHIYNYYSNALFYLKYLVYLGIYLILLLFFTIILRIQKRALQKRFEQEKYQMELELLTIKNQIDPHFTFNAINTISALIYEKESEKAHRFLVDFSNLIRNTLKNSKKNSVQLKDEVDFVKKYLSLQQIRHKNKFTFQIESKGEVDWESLVPRMIIQTFAENAVKHGLLEKKGQGLLQIRINQQENQLEIIISDNGIGRKQAQHLNKHSTGKGMDIIEQIVNMYNKLQNTKVSYAIKDEYDDNGNAKGTTVSVNIPVSN